MKKFLFLVIFLAPLLVGAQLNDTIFFKAGGFVKCQIYDVSDSILGYNKEVSPNNYVAERTLLKDVERYVYGSNPALKAGDKLTFTEVINVDSTRTKNELFDAARTWYNVSFKDSKEVLQIIDKETGELSGKGIIIYNSNIYVGSAITKGYISYTTSIFVKDGKYKYEFSNFIHTANGSASFGLITNELDPNFKCFDCWGRTWKENVFNDMKNQIENRIIPLISSLKEAMNKKVNNDW